MFRGHTGRVGCSLSPFIMPPVGRAVLMHGVDDREVDTHRQSDAGRQEAVQ